MQLKGGKLLVESKGRQKVHAVAWAPTGMRLAVATAERRVLLFDENGTERDKFPTKAADAAGGSSDNVAPGSGTYAVVGLAFSPDGSLLAVAQSDCSVFVYRLGTEWKEKKSICNKFFHTSPTTAVAWSPALPGEVLFGLADGRVRSGLLKTNKATTLYEHPSAVVALAVRQGSGDALVSGHADGSLWRHTLLRSGGSLDAPNGVIAAHPCPPVALAFSANGSIVASGSDLCSVVYRATSGDAVQTLQPASDAAQEFETAAGISTRLGGGEGAVVALGGYERVQLLSAQTGAAGETWTTAEELELEHFGSVTGLAWRPDGSRLAIAGARGHVQLLECCQKRARYRDQFDFAFAASDRVLVTRLKTGEKIEIASVYGQPIGKLDVYREQFLVAHTPETLLVGDLRERKLSELPWHSSGAERFVFDYPGLCLINNAGELCIVEYGRSSLLGAVRTEYLAPAVLSLQVQASGAVRIAYLVDPVTVRVQDATGTGPVADVGQMTLPTRIDWLELSPSGSFVLVRDRGRQLVLLTLTQGTTARHTLTDACRFAQWVPGADVAVAQARSQLCVWYAMDTPDQRTIEDLGDGTVVRVDRAPDAGTTTVLVDRGAQVAEYRLDERLVELAAGGGAVRTAADAAAACRLLEQLPVTGETEPKWRSLCESALRVRHLAVAERCYAALGDVARARFVHNLVDLVDKLAAAGDADPTGHFRVRAKLAVLEGNFRRAESLYLEHGATTEAIQMYQALHRWGASVQVAERRHYPELATLRRNYQSWLLETHQEIEAADVKLAEGDFAAAVQLYLQGERPAKAAHVLLKVRPDLLASQPRLGEQTAQALARAGIDERAGALWEKLGRPERALEAYERGRAFRAALDLARRHAPGRVVSLELAWGEHCVALKQHEAAVGHFVEAGLPLRAVEAALAGRQFRQAAAILDDMQVATPNSPEANDFKLQLAQHFCDEGDLAQAETYFCAAQQPKRALNMYAAALEWARVDRLANSVLGAQGARALLAQLAHEQEHAGRLRDAEQLLLLAGEADRAIAMYKEHRQYDAMLRLVAAHRAEFLAETHVYIAKVHEELGNHAQAETHFVAGGEWKHAVNMYCAAQLFEDAHRVARSQGGPNSAKQVAYLWAKALGGQAGARLLQRFKLLDSAIEHACEHHAFDFAFSLAAHAPNSAAIEAGVHTRHAAYLEDRGHYADAETAYVSAGKTDEAVQMYCHVGRWDDALRVATGLDADAVTNVLVAQGRAAFDAGEPQRMEGLFLQAQRPLAAIELYRSAGQLDRALAFAERNLPSMVAELQLAAAAKAAPSAPEAPRAQTAAGAPDLPASSPPAAKSVQKAPGGNKSKEQLLAAARTAEAQHNYAKAVEAYLALTPALVPHTDTLLGAWRKAVHLAAQYLDRPRATAVARTVAQNLATDLGRAEAAVDVLLRAELPRDAAELCATVGLWDRANDIAAADASLLADINARHVEFLRQQGEAEKLVQFNAAAAVEMFAAQHNWARCLEVATLHSELDPGLLQKYLGHYAAQLIRQGRCVDALDALATHDAVVVGPHAAAFADMYVRLAFELVHSHNGDPPPKEVGRLCTLLHSVQAAANKAQVSSDPELDRWLLIVHLTAMFQTCSQRTELQPLAARQAIALLRYCDILPAEWLFFRAGTAARVAGMSNMAYTCWNRLIDIWDALERGEGLGEIALDQNVDFEGTDVPSVIEPAAEPFPSSQKDKVREWVLETAYQAQTAHSLDTRTCTACGKQTYAAGLACSECKHADPLCVVTGYPALAPHAVCTMCGARANKADWNIYVQANKTCPWCAEPQTASYEYLLS